MVTVNARLWYIGEVTTSCSSQNAGFDARDDIKFARQGRDAHCQPDLLRPRAVFLNRRAVAPIIPGRDNLSF
jgi:hypothetical protein